MEQSFPPIEQRVDLGEDFDLSADLVIGDSDPITATAMTLLNDRVHIFLIAFMVTLLVTPLIRRLAMAADLIDQPDRRRKMHDYPVAYLGGLAVFLGLVAAIGFSYVSPVSAIQARVPLAVLLGMIVITFTGLIDDASGLFPRLKIAGQLVAAAALAINEIGVRVAEGLLLPFLGQPEEIIFTVFSFSLTNEHVIYWVGTALIAIFVLGGCNAANLIDGLDGLLSGVTAVIAIGLLAICVLMSLDQTDPGGQSTLGDARLVLCLALLGAALGFLPHNFNPASIFLGDCGSLLLGFVCVTVILMLGDEGKTQFVFAGLIVFALPIIDTTLAIIRRKLAGTSMSAADHQHLHHQLLRALGGVRPAVLAMYVISITFAVLGVSLAALVIHTNLRVRVVYAIALVLFSFIGAMAVKTAQLQQIRAGIAGHTKDAPSKTVPADSGKRVTTPPRTRQPTKSDGS